MGEYDRWPLEELLRERDAFRKSLAMALAEMNAGNRRMSSYAEGYAKRLDGLNSAIVSRTLQNTPGTNPPPSDASDASDGSDVPRPFSVDPR